MYILEIFNILTQHVKEGKNNDSLGQLTTSECQGQHSLCLATVWKLVPFPPHIIGAHPPCQEVAESAQASYFGMYYSSMLWQDYLKALFMWADYSDMKPWGWENNGFCQEV